MASSSSPANAWIRTLSPTISADAKSGFPQGKFMEETVSLRSRPSRTTFVISCNLKLRMVQSGAHLQYTYGSGFHRVGRLRELLFCQPVSLQHIGTTKCITACRNSMLLSFESHALPSGCLRAGSGRSRDWYCFCAASWQSLHKCQCTPCTRRESLSGGEYSEVQ